MAKIADTMVENTQLCNCISLQECEAQGKRLSEINNTTTIHPTETTNFRKCLNGLSPEKEIMHLHFII